MAFIETFILLTILIVLLYKWSMSKYRVFSERGIPHEKPKFLIGNLDVQMMLGRKSFLKVTIELYKRHKNSKIFGVYSFHQPAIIVTDLESIKKICIKDFDSFPNHSNVFRDIGESLFTKTLFALQDRQWKEMRNTLTPSFTGLKMRQMFELVHECCSCGVEYLKENLLASRTNEFDLEMKDYFTRFTNDVIASAAFGINVNSFKDKNNEFYTIGRAVLQLRGTTVLRAILFTLIPKIMKALGIKIMDQKYINYFNSLVLDAMKYRAEHKIIRPDMIHLLMEAKRHVECTDNSDSVEHLDFKDEELLVAQCFIFFAAGFETVSTCLCFTAYELLKHPEVQERLYEEILGTERELNGHPLNYDVLMKMKYMDMVISESLRKWPPAISTDRCCVNDYKLYDEDGNQLIEFKKGDNISIITAGLHYDEEYFANPHEFLPERFAEENRAQMNNSAYMPFGIGPRSCIGNRFALMETKAIIYQLLLNFEIKSNERTTVDMMKSMKTFRMEPKENFWMKFTPREQLARDSQM